MEGVDRIKVGISKSPYIRRVALLSDAPSLAIVYSAFPGEGRARELELRAHQILSEHRITGEWFSSDSKTAVEAVLQAAADLGLTLTEHEDEDCRILIRTDAATKAALEKAADADQRSVSILAERVLKAWLRENGYLPEVRKNK